jgi:PAS domain S-box-containing protein
LVDPRKSPISVVQDALQQSEARFQAMFNQSVIGIGMLSLDGMILDANSAVCLMLGRSLEELRRVQFTEMIHPDDRDHSGGQFKKLLAGEQESYRVQRRYLRADGDIFWANVTVSMVYDRERHPLFAVGLMEDIDEQIKMEAELYESQARLAEQEAEYRRTLEQRVEERTRALTEANHRLQREIEHRRRAEQALAGKAVAEAITTERTRLARDLHDAVTQTLFSASLIAEVLPELWEVNIEEAHRSTDELKQLTRGALAEMRTLLLELRPASLTQARFEDLVRQLADALIGRARLPIQVHVEGERRLLPDVQVALYRIAQESLNNVVKYAQASRVDVHVMYSRAGVHLEIADDGIGFEPGETKPTSLGLRIMAERAEAIGAELHIDSRPGQGTCVSATWTENNGKANE